MTAKRLAQTRRRSSYFRVSTKGSAPTSRSPSPATTATSTNVNATSSTAAYGTSSEEDIDLRTILEKELFELVKNRDSHNVQSFLRANHNININTQDTEGHTILHHAVINNDGEMVDILLKDNFVIDVYDSLLQAVSDNSIPMVIKIMKWNETMRSKARKIITTLFTRNKLRLDDGGAYYEDHMTPLLMAAIKGHYELIALLYEKGERLLDLHKPGCRCEKCGQPSADLKKSSNRIDLLKGVCNPTYMAFMAGVDKKYDPILKSFELVKDLKQWIQIEPEFKDEYEAILENVQKFPVELLSCCRDAEETSIVLTREEGYEGHGSTSSYPRLLLAIQYEQKEFVANENAQDVLYQDWTGEPWITTSAWASIRKKFILYIAAIFFPIVSIIFMFTLCCCKNLKMVKYINSPKQRCRSCCVSYLYFMAVIFVMNGTEMSRYYHGPPSHYLPWVVSIFALSHAVAFVRHLSISFVHFISQGWNIFELFSHIAFGICIGLWITVHIQIGKHGTIKKRDGTEKILPVQLLDVYDVLLVSEVATGVASTLAGLRMLRWFTLHSILGPLQIALAKMGKDILLFVFIFVVIIVSFALGFQHLYRPYIKLIKEPCAFCDFKSAVESLTYALFTMTGSDSPNLPYINITDNKTILRLKRDEMPPQNHHFFTEGIGRIMLVVHHILCVTFLLNMLVGMMSSTYSNIIENVRVEWKYGRAKLWLYYIQDDSLTPPFNLFPTCLCVFNFLLWVKAMLTKSGRQHAKFNVPNCCYVEEEKDQQIKKIRDNRYPFLLRRLLQRYFRSKSSTASEDVPVSGDIEEVQKQVVQLRELTTMTLDLKSNPNSGTNINAGGESQAPITQTPEPMPSSSTNIPIVPQKTTSETITPPQKNPPAAAPAQKVIPTPTSNNTAEKQSKPKKGFMNLW